MAMPLSAGLLQTVRRKRMRGRPLRSILRTLAVIPYDQREQAPRESLEDALRDPVFRRGWERRPAGPGGP